MHVTRSSKSLEKCKIMRKLLSDPLTRHKHSDGRIIISHDSRKNVASML